MNIIQLIQNLIGTPIYTVDCVINGVTEQRPVFDLAYLIAGILLLMTVWVIYSLLLHMIKFIGRSKK